MLTPAFEINQDHAFITFIIKTPYARVTDTEIFIEHNEFRFHSKPYFLRLTLPGNIVEDGREEAKYDADKGSFTVRVPKETEGETFEGLDMITKLLTPKGQTTIQSPLIEVLDDAQTEEEEEEEEDFDWHIEQSPYKDEELSLDCPKYGFANQKLGVFKRLQDEIVDIVDLKTPDQCIMSDRREKRQIAETEKFDEDHYLADLYDDDAIQGLLCYCPSDDSLENFDEEERERMKNLPKKEYLIDNKISVYLGLVDIIFAYCYDRRTTEGEHNVESSWTISKLSSTLSWLDMFSSLQEVLTASYRRCLSYPLYRHWELTVKIHQDTAEIFSHGKKRILKCLLDIHKCFSECYPRNILNDLYITDYCVWIQSSDSKQIQSLAEALKKCTINKSDVGFNLPATEGVGIVNDLEDVTEGVSNVHISQHDSDDDSTDRSGTCSETDEESTDSLSSSTESDDEEHNEKKNTVQMTASNTEKSNAKRVRNGQNFDRQKL